MIRPRRRRRRIQRDPETEPEPLVLPPDVNIADAETETDEENIAEPAPVRVRRNADRGYNSSTWLINIGTHKKPFDEEEYHLLDASLENAIEQTLQDPMFYRIAYYAVGTGTGFITKLKDPVFRNQVNLRILSQKAHYNIERGGKQGRIDAHIILSVKHERHIQFDHNSFQSLLDSYLERENERFIAERVMSRRNPSVPLRWAEPNLYVSFRRIGGHTMRDTTTYINKANDARPGIRQDRQPLYESDMRNMTNLVPIISDWVDSRGGRPGLDVGRVYT